jgi:nucleoside-diphosphate-sugar epimerase
MHVLVIGGTRFVGYGLVWRLIAQGHTITILNRGSLPDPFGDRVERIHVDRTSQAFTDTLSHRTFDAAVDFAAFTGADGGGVIDALLGRVGHYIFISSGQVYLVTTTYAPPAAESAYHAPLLPRPTNPSDLEQWQYGMGKREAEDVLRKACTERGFPATILRLPMVNGERDASGRVEAYIWRLLDGGPVLVPDGGQNVVRHIYAGDVVSCISSILGNQSTVGVAYNLAQDEQPDLRSLVGMLANLLGAPDRAVGVSSHDLRAAGLDPRAISPFSSPWISCIDPTLAREELHFTPTPLEQYLGRIIASFLAHPPEHPSANYQHRAAEIALAAGR